MDHREEHHVRQETPGGGMHKEDVSIRQTGGMCGTEQQRDVNIRQDLPGGGMRKVEEHVNTSGTGTGACNTTTGTCTGEEKEGIMSKAAKKLGLKD